MNSSPSEPCSLCLQLVSLRLESPGTSSQVSVALPQQLLHVVLCVRGYTTLLRKIRVVLGYIASLSLLCDLFKIDSLKLGGLLSVRRRRPSVPAILLADGMRFLSMRARMSSKIFWSSASTSATYSFAYDACCSLSCFLCCVQFVPLCQQPQPQTGLPSEPWQPSRSQPPSHVSLFFGILLCNRPGFFSDKYNCLLPLLLFLCHTLFQIGIFLFLNFTFLLNLDLVFSCFLGNIQFLFCRHALMTFSVLVSRHRSNFSLRDIVLLIRLGLQLALLFLFF